LRNAIKRLVAGFIQTLLIRLQILYGRKTKVVARSGKIFSASRLQRRKDTSYTQALLALLL
jgi:hypothetical protein